MSAPKFIMENLEIVFCIPVIIPTYTEKTHLLSETERMTPREQPQTDQVAALSQFGSQALKNRALFPRKIMLVGTGNCCIYPKSHSACARDLTAQRHLAVLCSSCQFIKDSQLFCTLLIPLHGQKNTANFRSRMELKDGICATR